MLATHYLKVDLFHQCDIELLLTGAFYPLNGFMIMDDYISVLESSHLTNGIFWPLPITLPVDDEFANQLTIHDEVILQDEAGENIAILTVADIWKPNKLQEVISVYGTIDLKHAGVNRVLNQEGSVYIGGPIRQLKLPFHTQYPKYCKPAYEVRAALMEKDIKNVVAFQTRNPMHRAHFELTKRAMETLDAFLLLQPTIGPAKIGDIDHVTRIKCYEHILKYYPRARAALILLPLAMRMAGPKEALLHGIIRRNYGCTHMIIGRDHAGYGKRAAGEGYHKPYEAQREFIHYQNELGIKLIKFSEMVYAKDLDKYISVSEVTKENDIAKISGTEFRRKLKTNEAIPDWFSFSEIIEELRHAEFIAENHSVNTAGTSFNRDVISSRLLVHSEKNRYGESIATIILGCKDLIGITESEVEVLIKHMEIVKYPKKTLIVEQGKQHSLYCIIISGRASVLIENAGKVSPVALVSIGDTIGHIEIDLKSMKRTANATVVSLEEMELLQLQIPKLRELAEQFPDLTMRLTQRFQTKTTMNFFKKHPAFSLLPHNFSFFLSKQAKILKFARGTQFYSRRVKQNKGFILISGEAQVQQRDEDKLYARKHKLLPGAIINNETLSIFDQDRHTVVVALIPVTVYSIPANIVQLALSLNMKKFIELSDETIQKCRIPIKEPNAKLITEQLSKKLGFCFVEDQTKQIFLPISEAQVDVWHDINGKRSISELLARYLKKYDQRTANDVITFIYELEEAGLVAY